jgi:hypothetical protein
MVQFRVKTHHMPGVTTETHENTQIRRPVSEPRINLRLVLYGCETWSLTLREEYRLRVFENRVLRRIFVPKRRKW